MKTQTTFNKKSVISLAVVAVMLVVALCTVFGAGIAYAEEEEIFKTPSQINVTVTETYDTVVVTFTTVDTNMRDAKVLVSLYGSAATTAYSVVNVSVQSVVDSNMRDSSNNKVSQKAFYTVKITGLSPDTHYSYYCSVRDNYKTYRSDSHEFWTQMLASSEDSFQFIYCADPQECSIDGKATTTTSAIAKAIVPDAKFLYIGGDVIDGSVSSNYFSEGQYETLFNQQGSNYNANFDNMMSDFTLAVARGNHDDWQLNNHIILPSTSINSSEHYLTYAFNWGMLRLIVINTEERSESDYADQKQFIKQQVEDAHSNGQYAALCMHRSLYTGADHISSADSVERRKELSAFLSNEVNIDFVLQAHDHCLARGQVDGTGQNCGDQQKIADRIWYDAMPSNGPLYFVGGCMSSYKTYDAINFTPDSEDPCALNYAFLDLNDAEPAGSDRNPGPCEGADGQVSFTKVTVSADFVRFDTYMYGYDAENDVITYAPYLYDSYTVTKNKETYADNYHSITATVEGDTTTQVLVANSAPQGDRVFVSANVGEGRAIDKVVVTSAGKEIAVQQNQFGYTFDMPQQDVTVTLYTKVDPKLPVQQNSVQLVGQEAQWQCQIDVTDLPQSAFTADATGWISDTDISDASVAIFKKTVTLSETDVADIAGLVGSHNLNGWLIVYLNGSEVYRFNAGKYGTTTVGRNVVLDKDGFPVSAEQRTLSVMENYDNRLTEYRAVNGMPVFEAGSLSALKSAAKVGQNVLTCVVVKTEESDTFNFSLQLDLALFKQEMYDLWASTKANLDALLTDNPADWYSSENYTLVQSAVEEAQSTVDSHLLTSPAQLSALVAQTSAKIASIPSVVSAVEEMIVELDNVATAEDMADVVAAREAYNALTAEQQANVSNYQVLLAAEDVGKNFAKELKIASQPNKVKYTAGEQADFDGLVVAIVTYGGTEKMVDLSKCKIDKLDTSVVGTHTLNVEYNGLSAQFTVKVGNGAGQNVWWIVLVAVGAAAVLGTVAVAAVVLKKRGKAK